MYLGSIGMKLYVRTTLDKYELPVAVAEGPAELARMLGVRPNVVSSSLSHKRRGYYVVEVEDDEEPPKKITKEKCKAPRKREASSSLSRKRSGNYVAKAVKEKPPKKEKMTEEERRAHRRKREAGHDSVSNKRRRKKNAESIKNCDQKIYREEWNDSEVEYLIKNYRSKTKEEIANDLGRTLASVERKRNRLNLLKEQ